jgi:hypothetical protein
MIHDVPKPDIGHAFSIDDIHKIRKWHYDILKDASVQERMDFYNGDTMEQRTKDTALYMNSTIV